MKFSLVNESPRLIETECLVIGVTAGGGLSASARDIDEASGGEISRMLETGDIETGLGKTTLLHRVSGVAAQRVLVAGCGKQEKLDQPRFDRACQAAGQDAARPCVTSCHVSIHDLEFGASDNWWRLRQAALAVHRANYLYTVTKAPKDGSPRPWNLLPSAGTNLSKLHLHRRKDSHLVLRKPASWATCRRISATPPTLRKRLHPSRNNTTRLNWKSLKRKTWRILACTPCWASPGEAPTPPN